jgi:protein-S-isoprenylcysteine O-methyltransferase Ste14
MTDPGDHPAVRVFPPLIFLGGLAAGFLMDLAWPVPIAAGDWRPAVQIAGCVLLVFWIALDAAALIAFRRVRTSPNPTKPTSALAFAGPYRFTRNPMYLGLLCMNAGAALAANALWPLATVPVVILLVRRLVIDREEMYLEAKFGDAYRQYKTRVRRWV